MSRYTKNMCELRHKARRLLLLEIAAVVGLSGINIQSYADIKYGADATANYEYDTNVFDLPGGDHVAGVSRRSDWFQSYGGTLQVVDSFSQDKLYATFSGKDIRYNNYTDLDHAEYSFDGGFNWKQGSNLDGNFDVLRTRTMVAFSDIIQTQLAIVTTQKETAQIGWVFIPDWRVQATGDYLKTDQPEVNAPDLQLTSRTIQGALQYVGVAGLNVGLSEAHERGDFAGAQTGIAGDDNPNYTQDALQLVVTWQPTASSTLVGQGGYSRRTSVSSANTTKAPTGLLTYKNQLTAKTSVFVTGERDIYSYLTNSGSILTTSGIAGATWQATYRLGITADYNYRHSVLPDQGLIPGTTRVDNYQFWDVKLDYQPLRWLWLEPYVHVQDRSSNYYPAQFNSSAVGVNFNLLWHCPNDHCTQFAY